jgi:DNA-binding beta-propeller fold protein YncE
VRDRLTFILLCVLAPSIGGCESVPPVTSPEIPAAALVWPKSPAEARIRYVRSFSGPSDLGITRSLFRRFMDAVTGKTEEYLIRPTGVAEREDILYVADPGAQAIWIFDLPQRRFTKIHRAGNTPLASPVAIAVRSDGAVFIADSSLRKIFLLDREGKLLQTFPEDGLERPAALAYDDNRGRLYVADSAAHRIIGYSGGAQILAWGKRGSADGEFNFPTHLALDQSGALLVTDALNFRIQAFDQEGKFLWKMGHHGDSSGNLAAPKGVATDSQGHLYVVDALFDAVQIFDRNGTLLLAFGEHGAQRGQFWLPGGIFINSRNRIYVADAYNQRIQIFDFVGAR